jgi:hypothetical protein
MTSSVVRLQANAMQKTNVTVEGERFVVTRQNVQKAMEQYNSNFRVKQNDAGTRYAVLDNKRRSYPPKRLLSLIIRKPRSFFSGGTFTNRVFQDLEFEVKHTRRNIAPIKGSAVDLDAPIPRMGELIATLFRNRWGVLVGPSCPKPDWTSIQDGNYPGVYVLAYGQQRLAGRRVREKDVIYVGMTHAGLKVRLKQFVDGIERNCCHSGARTFFRRNGKRRPYSANPSRLTFFVATVSVPCIVSKTKRSPRDLEKMGAVCELELYVLARIKKATGREPDLNTH